MIWKALALGDVRLPRYNTCILSMWRRPYAWTFASAAAAAAQVAIHLSASVGSACVSTHRSGRKIVSSQYIVHDLPHQVQLVLVVHVPDQKKIPGLSLGLPVVEYELLNVREMAEDSNPTSKQHYCAKVLQVESVSVGSLYKSAKLPRSTKSLY